MEKVSVVIPCYNQGEYLDECVNSVIKQSYKNIEIVIVDDGSTDNNTIKIIDKIIEEKNNNIIVVRKKNGGLSSARNAGIKNSTGKYILPLDGDDKIHEDYVKKAVSILENDTNIGVVYCIAMLFGEKDGLWSIKDYDIVEMLSENLVFCTAMYRKSDYDRTSGYNENMKYGLEDWDFWLSLIELGLDFYRINEVLFYYRYKKKSMLRDISNRHVQMKVQVINNHKQLYLNNIEKIIEKEYLLKNTLVNKIINFINSKKQILRLKKYLKEK